MSAPFTEAQTPGNIFDPGPLWPRYDDIEVRLTAHAKTQSFQQPIVSVLNSGSQELWRVSSRERAISAVSPDSQSGAFIKEARKHWGFLPLSFRGERVCGGTTGGGRGAGGELSRRGGAKPLGRLRKLPLRSVYAALRSFPPGRDWPQRTPSLCEVSPSSDGH